MTDPSCENLIMIVDDDVDVRESIAEVLKDNRYQPMGAANGKDALDQLRLCGGSGKPCVILLDIMMPVMDGWEFRAVQSGDPTLSTIPVVVLTAHTNVVDAASKMHAAGCLKKPVQLDLLLQMVERFCHVS